MKDPAFLFYSSDFLSGTMLMTDEEIGQYIKLLCLQHQKGHLKEKELLNVCKGFNEEIFSKFNKDENGNYFNKRLEDEIDRRKKYSESRRNNRKKKDSEEKNKTYDKDMKNICNSYEEHMETETVTITKNEIEIKEDKDRDCQGEGKEEIVLELWESQFNQFYAQYPRKLKKQETKKWFKKNKPSNELFNTMMNSLEQFRASTGWQKDGGKYIPHPSTWLNQKRWEDEDIEQNKPMSALERAFLGEV